MFLPGAGRTSFFFKELISQTHKITTDAMGFCALKDNYRVTPVPWSLVCVGGGRQIPPEALSRSVPGPDTVLMSAVACYLREASQQSWGAGSIISPDLQM